MASLSCPSPYPVRCSANAQGNDTNKPKLNNIKINGTSSSSSSSSEPWSRTKVDYNVSSGVSATMTSVAPITENECIIQDDQLRQNIPTKKQFVDSYRQGLIIEGGVGYRQTVVIRSYEVGPDKTTTIESILNLLQETALNHVWMSGLLSDGFGATHGMMRNNLIWVVSRMQVQVDHYPIWGEVIEIDTWVAASGKNGMRRDWMIRSQATGVVFARATSTWVMMNEKTRRLSKMPEEVRAEISPWFIHKQAINEDNPEKIVKLDNKAPYVISDLKPKRSDLDMNQHVNNVKYVGWMLEAIPDHVLESQQLSGIIMEYRRECGSSDIVESLCEPDNDGILEEGVLLKHGTHINLLNGFMEGNGLLGSFNKAPQKFTHLLQINGNNENKKEELVRGKTIWKQKVSSMPFPHS